MNTKIKIFLIIVLSFVLTGCSIQLGSNKKTGDDSGVYISYDKGETWTQKVEFLNVGPNRSFFKSGQSTFIKQDLNDPKAIYVGTLQDGLLYSFDGGLGWQKTLSNKGVVYDVSIDSKYRCTWYSAVNRRIYKSEDCGRNWREIHVDSNNQNFRSVVVDHINTNKVYAITGDGRLYKSEDFGGRWSMIKSFDNIAVSKLVMNHKNPGILYVCKFWSGIFKSENEGFDWINIVDNINLGDGKQLAGIKEYKDFEFDLSKDDAFFYANKYGIFYSQDGGNTWNVLNLLSKPGSVDIYSITSNPNNPKEIYYTIYKKFYKSLDGGNTWTAKTLTTNQIRLI